MAADGFMSSILQGALGGGGGVIVGVAVIYLLFGSTLASVDQLEKDIDDIKSMISSEQLVKGSILKANLETINTRIDAIEKRLEAMEKVLNEIRDKI